MSESDDVVDEDQLLLTLYDPLLEHSTYPPFFTTHYSNANLTQQNAASEAYDRLIVYKDPTRFNRLHDSRSEEHNQCFGFILAQRPSDPFDFSIDFLNTNSGIIPSFTIHRHQLPRWEKEFINPWFTKDSGSNYFRSGPPNSASPGSSPVPGLIVGEAETEEHVED